jgi:transcriptional regulator with XRE-family HTH domain
MCTITAIRTLASWLTLELDGRSPELIANAIGVTQETLESWRTGIAIPSDEDAVRLAIALGADIRTVVLLARGPFAVHRTVQ